MREKEVKFIGLDGEAINDDYVLLQDSTGRVLYNDGKRLTTWECLSFIWQLGQLYPRKEYTLFPLWFGSSYDINHIIRDIPPGLLAKLWERGEVVWKIWRLEWFPGKMFSVYIDGEGVKTHDLFGFCQTSFVKSLKNYRLARPDQLEALAGMKAKRGNFERGDITAIMDYNRLEVELLAELGQIIYDLHDQLGLTLHSLHGAGATSAAMLKQHGVRQYIVNHPLAADRPIKGGYFGGRIQLLWQGRFKELHIYDLNSAYPFAASQLPGLVPGRWQRVKGNREIMPYHLYRVRFRFKVTNHLVYPLPVRTRRHTIAYPPYGEGWYWGVELLGAASYAESLEIIETVIPLWDYEARPFAFIPEYYELRQEYKKADDMRQIAIKLGLNATYGKMAQSSRTAGRKAPPYHSLIYAGLITATCRAALMGAVRGRERYIVAFATDGITAVTPLELPLSNRLGEWDYKAVYDGVYIQPGVYWYHDENGEAVIKSRGILASELQAARPVIEQGLERGELSISFSTRRFQGLGLSLRQSGIDPNWLKWPQSTRKLELQSEWWRPCRFPDMYPLESVYQKARPMFNPIIPNEPSYPYTPKEEWIYNEQARAQLDNLFCQPEWN